MIRSNLVFGKKEEHLVSTLVICGGLELALNAGFRDLKSESIPVRNFRWIIIKGAFTKFRNEI